MQKRFGFIASQELVMLIQEANEALNNDAKDMYINRNKLIEKVADELIEKMIMDIANRVNDPERKDNIQNLGNTISSVVSKIVKVMLTKDKNKVVLQSKPFLEDSVAKDSSGQIRMGFQLPESFYNQATKSFDKISNGEHDAKLIADIKDSLKQLDDLLLGHFVVDFVKTLGWGAIKMNLAKGTKATISKADSMMIDKMIGKMTLEQLQEILPHFQDLLFESDILGLDVL